MSPPLPHAAAPHRVRWGLHVAAWTVGLLLALAWDRAAYLHLAVVDEAALEHLRGRDWHRTLRVAGSMWPWLIIGLALVLLDSARLRRAGAGERSWTGLVGWRHVFRRGTLLVVSAALSGLAAELLKRLVGRLRPNQADGWYAFKPLLRGFTDDANLGMPSSHAAVAFGAAFALSLMHPRIAPVAVGLAIGCALTRMVEGAHFLSDVYIALLLGYAISRWLWLLDLRNHGGIPVTGTGRAADAAAAGGATDGSGVPPVEPAPNGPPRPASTPEPTPAHREPAA